MQQEETSEECKISDFSREQRLTAAQSETDKQAERKQQISYYFTGVCQDQ